MNKSLEYILELRQRLIYCLSAVTLLALVLMPFSNKLYYLIEKPLLKQLPPTSTLIATTLPATFLVPLKLSIFAAIILSIPLLLYQFWAFTVPALYRHERSWIWKLLFFSTLLFYSGLLFSYTIVCPFIFKFFIQTTPAGVRLLPEINEYLTLIIQFGLAFGFAFEIPIILLGLEQLNIVSLEQLLSVRRYFIVLAFIIALFITPPDVLSQSMLAVPMCLLYEMGLLFIRIKNNFLEKHETENISRGR